MKQTTQTTHLAQVTELARTLVDLVSAQPTHQVALEALISAFASVAVCHPCCAHKAANTARKVADFIDTHSAGAGASHPHVH